MLTAIDLARRTSLFHLRLVLASITLASVCLPVDLAQAYEDGVASTGRAGDDGSSAGNDAPVLDTPHQGSAAAAPRQPEFGALDSQETDITEDKLARDGLGQDVGSLITRLIDNGSRAIHLACGHYRLTSPISISKDSVNLYGDGACTVLVLDSSVGNGVYEKSHQYIQIHDLTIEAGVRRLSGAAIYLHEGFANKIYNVQFTNAGTGLHYNDVVLDGANGTVLEGLSGRGGAGSGVLALGGERRSQDVYMSNSGFDGFAVAPVELRWVSGVYLVNLDLLGGGQAGVYLHPSGREEVDGLRAVNVLSDSNIGPGWRLSGDGEITEINLTNCWGSTNGDERHVSSGIAVDDPNSNDVTVSSSEFHNNSGHGIDVEDGVNILLNGNAVFMNSIYRDSGYDGIHIGARADYINVSGNMVGEGPLHSRSLANGKQSNYQRYGVFVASGYVGHLNVTDNIAHGNRLGDINVPQSPRIVSKANMGG